MPYLDTTDPTLAAFLRYVKGAFSECGTTVRIANEYTIRTIEDTTITIKRNSVLEFVRVPAVKRRKGDPSYKASPNDRLVSGPYVWWNFFVRYQNEYPVSFVVRENGEVYCRPRSQESRHGYARRRYSLGTGE